MLISRSKTFYGRSSSEKSRSPPSNSVNGSPGRDSSCEGDGVPIPPRRAGVGKHQTLKKYYSYEEGNLPEVNNGTSDIIKVNNLQGNDSDKENQMNEKNTFNSIPNSVTLIPKFQKSSSGSSGGSAVVLLDNSEHSNGGNGQGSDDTNNDNEVSSPEILLPPFVTAIPSIVAVNSRQSLKHLSASAPAIQSNLRAMGSDSEFSLAPSSSKSRQKKFHRHFKTVAPDEKVLDYYSCALVGDILLQGYLYITENNFAFYSNVFGYVTKLLIPVCSVVRITKERTAKIIPNAVGLCTRSEKHVFASLLSRDTTYKLMCKVWNYSIDQEAKEVLKITTKLKEEDKGSGDLSVPDESSAESGSGNDSTIEPSSPSTIGKLAGTKVSNLPGSPGGRGSLGSQSLKGLSSSIHAHHPISSASIVGAPCSTVVASTTYARLPHRTSVVQANQPMSNLTAFSNKKPFESNGKTRGPSLILLATALLVILFLSAAFLLNRISTLQDKLSLKPTFRDSDQFYQELLLWQNKLHSSSAEEIHQYINMNLQQIIRVRQSLEALSLLFMSSQAENAKISETAYQSRTKEG